MKTLIGSNRFSKGIQVAAIAAVVLTVSMAAQAQGPPAGVVPGSYIVQVVDGADPGNVARLVARRFGGAVGHVYTEALNGFSIQLPPGLPAARMFDYAAVVSIEPDLVVTTCGQTLPTGIDRIDAELNTTPGPVDVDIAIIDTGIDTDHPDLPAVVGGRHFYTIATGPPWQRGSSEDDNYDDDNGHGSHVAGTAAALDNDIGVVGVAPGARLWAVKVLDKTGSGYLSDVVAGIDWVTGNADQIEVANMSLAWQENNSAARTAIQGSVAAGVVYVVAAANKATDVYGPDGNFGTSDDFEPASYPEVATISAMADSDGQPEGIGADTSYGADDSFASFSNYSASGAIDLLLPGVDIYSTYKGGGYATMSGTSMASPHAAGLVALYIAENGRASDAAGVTAVRQALIDGGVAQDSDQGLATLNDPDDYWENIGWAGTPPSPNDAPTVSITSPADGSTFDSGATIDFAGTASDKEDGDLTASLVWTSSIDGQIGTGGSFSATLSDGNHTVTASVTDSGGKTGSDSISITVGTVSEPTTVSVSSITYGTIGGGKHLLITVALVDDLGNPVADASVEATLNLGEKSWNFAGTTASDGTVTFKLLNAPSGTYTTEVTNVTAEGLTWDSETPTNSFPKG